MEHRLDDTLSACGAMLQQFTEGRRVANYAAQVGQPALEQFTLFTHQMVLARGALIGVHEAMESEGLRMGMVYDPLEGKPPTGGTDGPKGALEVAAKA